jgi:hypothetical protein
VFFRKSLMTQALPHLQLKSRSSPKLLRVRSTPDTKRPGVQVYAADVLMSDLMVFNPGSRKTTCPAHPSLPTDLHLVKPNALHSNSRGSPSMQSAK